MSTGEQLFLASIAWTLVAQLTMLRAMTPRHARDAADSRRPRRRSHRRG